MDHQPRRSTELVQDHFAALRDKRLVQHPPFRFPGMTLFPVAADRKDHTAILFQRQREKAGDVLFGHVIGSRSEPAGSNDDIAGRQGSFDGIGNGTAVIPDLQRMIQRQPLFQQFAADKRKIGVDRSPFEQFIPDTE